MHLKFLDKYRFEIIAPGWGSFNAFPSNDELKFKWSREKEQMFIFRKKLNTSLIFVNNVKGGVSDFDKLYAVESSTIFNCQDVQLNVYMICEGSEHLWFRGKLAFVEGDWDVDHCVLRITPRVFDVYDCIFNMWEKELNIFGVDKIKINIKGADICNLPKEVVLENIISEQSVLETITCYETFATNVFNVGRFSAKCLPNYPNQKGWAIYKNTNQAFDFSTKLQVETTWAREKAITACLNGLPNPPLGDGWILLENNCPTGCTWVRKPPESQFKDGVFKNIKFTNGRRLNDVIKYLVGDWPSQVCFPSCNYKVKSNFFGIDPDADPLSVNNIAYQKAVQRCWRLVIYHITDVARWDIGTPTTLQYKDESKRPLFITLKKLLGDLRVMFNAHWYIDETTPIPTLRIEHYSWFKKNFMLDLIQDSVDGKSKFYKFTNGSFKYNYSKENLPKKENFKFMYQTDIGVSGDFDGVPIEYPENCSATQDDNFQCELFTTHVNHIISNPSKFEGSEGYVLMESDGEGHFVRDIGAISKKPQLNGLLSFANLHEAFHQHGRPVRSGKMNSINRVFKSYKKAKVQRLQIPFCCTDMLQFNALDLVKTQLGWGDVNDVTYTEPSEVLDLELYHT